MTQDRQPHRKPLASQYRVRLDALVAANGRNAVILRRGPRTHYQLINWDTLSDVFLPGQWMHGGIRLFDLSPDGRYLLYFAQQFRRYGDRARDGQSDPAPGYEPLSTQRPKKRRHRRKLPRYQREFSYDGLAGAGPRAIGQTWTAISRPPYFSALAVWPTIGTHDAGALFADARTIVLLKREDALLPKVNVTMPGWLSLQSYFSPAYQGQLVSASAMPLSPTGADKREIAVALRSSGVRWIEWIWLDPHRGGVVFACDGRVYRASADDCADPATLLQNARMLADFTASTFEAIAPPASAMRW